MKNSIAFFLIFFSIQSWGQNVDLEKRLDYFKNHRLFVMKIELKRRKSDQERLDSILNFENSMNTKMKKCLDEFWDLNDSIYYFNIADFKDYKKKYPDDIFLIWEGYGYVGYLNILVPKNQKLIADVSPRLPIMQDTSLLGITQEIRLLRQNIVTGYVWYIGPDITKTLLFLDEPIENEFQKQYVQELKAKYPSYDIVDRHLLTELIYSRDPRYIYVTNLYVINVEDGSLLQLE